MTAKLTRNRARPRNGNPAGMSLIEMMVAMLILTVGVLAAAVLIPLSIGSNFKNRQQSNSTVIAQMTMEKMLSIPAAASPSLSLTDCKAVTSTISTAGSPTGAGAPLLASGEVDFSQAALAGYSMLYTTCGTSGSMTYDVRWNIKTVTSNVKLIVVSAVKRGVGTDPRMFALPVTLRSIAGPGE